MKKRKLIITLITINTKEEYNLLGEYDQENGIITYDENNNITTKVKLDLKRKLLIRDNHDYYLMYKLIENEETENEIRMKELNQSLSLKIKTDKFKVTDNKVEIIYTILDSKETIQYQIEF